MKCREMTFAEQPDNAGAISQYGFSAFGLQYDIFINEMYTNNAYLNKNVARIN